MSQRCISNKIEKTCDGCGLVEIQEMIEQKTPEQIEQLTRWLTIIREYYDLATDRWHKGLVQAEKAAEGLQVFNGYVQEYNTTEMFDETDKEIEDRSDEWLY